MRKVLFILGVSLVVTLVGLLKLVLPPRVTESSVKAELQEAQRAKLTEAEERDLQQFIPQTLSWIAAWREPTTCSVNDEIQKLDFAATYKKLREQEIEVGLEIRERSLVVYLDSLQTSLTFERLYPLGLSPAEINLFCEKSYEEYKAQISRMQELSRPRYEEMQKEQRKRDPKSALAMDKIREMQPSVPEDKVIEKELRRYRLTQNEASTNAKLLWNDEKKPLYKRVLDVVRDQTKFACMAGEAVEATIPDFKVGDPALYVLIKGPFYGGGEYIEWIDFDRDSSTGEYTARHVKSFGLLDETQSYVGLIRQKQISKLRLKCPAK
jgi:hypothetical protein